MKKTWSEIHRGINVNPEREDFFRDKFLVGLKEIGLSPKNFEIERLRGIIKLTFELIQNVYDHANRKPWLERKEIHSFAEISHDKNSKFLKIIVEDNGVGLACRQSQKLDIYDSPIEDEIEIFNSVFENRISVKLQSSDCRIRGTAGYGLTYFIHYIEMLKGFCKIRSGRLEINFDGKTKSSALQTDFIQGTIFNIRIPICLD